MEIKYLRLALVLGITLTCQNIFCGTERDIGQYVSLIEVIANKDKYHGKVVFIEGYFYAKDETCAIFLSKEHAENRLNKNAIWLDIWRSEVKPDTLKKANKRYVYVRGTYTTNDCGHLAAHSGGITNIVMIRNKN